MRQPPHARRQALHHLDQFPDAFCGGSIGATIVFFLAMLAVRREPRIGIATSVSAIAVVMFAKRRSRVAVAAE